MAGPKCTAQAERADRSALGEAETNVTDIELMPDGRIFVFGTSRQVLEVLSELKTADEDAIAARLNLRVPEKSSHQTNRESSS
jgi:hypothetical protein